MKVLVFGTFDQLHPGHLFLLEEAAKRGELFVVVARDANVKHIKGRLPVQGENERLQSIQTHFPDANVLLGNAQDYLAPVRQIDPDLILLGYDQRMPPAITEEDLPCPVERIAAFKPEEFKSSKRRE